MKKVLLYGPRKSGTTLLQSLIDGHPEITVFPGEFKIKNFHHFFNESTKLSEKFLEMAHSLYFRDFQNSKDHHAINDFFCYSEFYNELKRESESCQDLKSLIDLEATTLTKYLKSDAKFIAYKEVGGNTELVIFTMKLLYPDAKIILLKRDSRSIVSSIIRDRKRKNVLLSAKSILGEVWEAYRINKYIDLLCNLDMNLHVVNYEDLISDTKKELKSIAYYLEVPFNPILLKPTSLGMPTIVKTSSLNTTKVVKTTKNWKTGLTIREKILIATGVNILKSIPHRLEKK